MVYFDKPNSNSKNACSKSRKTFYKSNRNYFFGMFKFLEVYNLRSRNYWESITPKLTKIESIGNPCTSRNATYFYTSIVELYHKIIVGKKGVMMNRM